MAIIKRRFDPANAVPGHEGTIIGSNVLPDSMTAPFWHQYGYLQNNGTAMAGHAHPTDEIYIVFSGTGYVIVGGKNHPVSAGDLVVIPAGEWHTMMCTDKDEAPLLWAAIWWDVIEPVPNELLGDIHVSRFNKEKAYPDHQNTILADKIVPSFLKTPFDHSYGYMENGNTMELHAHPAEEFYIVYSGNGIVTIGDEQSEVSPGDVIEVPPNVMHTMTAPENGSITWTAFWWNA